MRANTIKAPPSHGQGGASNPALSWAFDTAYILNPLFCLTIFTLFTLCYYNTIQIVNVKFLCAYIIWENVIWVEQRPFSIQSNALVTLESKLVSNGHKECWRPVAIRWGHDVWPQWSHLLGGTDSPVKHGGWKKTCLKIGWMNEWIDEWKRFKKPQFYFSQEVYFPKKAITNLNMNW